MGRKTSTTVNEVIASNVAARRRALALSQEDVAALAEAHGLPWSRSIVDRAERAARRITAEELVILARALAISPLALVLPETDAEIELGAGDSMPGDRYLAEVWMLPLPKRQANPKGLAKWLTQPDADVVEVRVGVQVSGHDIRFQAAHPLVPVLKALYALPESAAVRRAQERVGLTMGMLVEQEGRR